MLSVFNLAPVFINETVKDLKINFNQTFEYKLPEFHDPEGMFVYVYV